MELSKLILKGGTHNVIFEQCIRGNKSTSIYKPNLHAEAEHGNQKQDMQKA